MRSVRRRRSIPSTTSLMCSGLLLSPGRRSPVLRSMFQPNLDVITTLFRNGCMASPRMRSHFRYDPGHYLLFTVDLPLVFQVEEATPDEPYLGLRLDLDQSLVASVLMESGIKFKKGDASAKAMDVHFIDPNLLDAVVRLVRLTQEPESRNILAPLSVKEIIYRLLAGGQGARLGHMLASGDTQRISRAIGHLREHFDEPLKIDDIARRFGMSVSGFHHHFKSVTAMSPLQFQKQIRLQEARRLMLGDDLDTGSAAFRVGYEDPSYFSRDYKKL